VPASLVIVLLVSGTGKSPLELAAVEVASIDSVTVMVDVISLLRGVVYTVVVLLSMALSVTSWRQSVRFLGLFDSSRLRWAD
jgi:hypothetical protein